MADVVFSNLAQRALRGQLNLPGVTIKAALIASGYSAAGDKHADTLADLNSSGGIASIEHDGSYTRITVSNVTVTDASGSDPVKIDCDDLSFAAVAAGTVNIVGVLFYLHVTDDTDGVPLGYKELPSAFAPSGGAVSIPIHADGLFTVDQAA